MHHRMVRIFPLVLAFSFFCFALPVFAQPPVVSVPGDTNLANAFNLVADGGIIEIAGGTYNAPTNGFLITDPNRRFTVRAANGATVVLSGTNSQPILRYDTTNTALAGGIVFENLIFRDGRSTTDAWAGGVTVTDGDATFVDCTFEDNESDAPVTGGGGLAVFGDSVVKVIRGVFRNNSATNEGGGLKVGRDTVVFVVDSQFLGNRVNLAGHRATSAGGGIHVGNGTLRVSGTRFANNEAGYVGGGLYAIGTWTLPYTVPQADVMVSNCTFDSNRAEPFPGINPPAGTEGGGVHAEDQATVRIYHSRFFDNEAENGAGLNLYRAIVEVEQSVFEGNIASDPGFGGAVSAISNDAASPDDLRPASITIRDSLLRGGPTAQAKLGGCLYAQGDTVAPASPSSDLVTVVLERVVFYQCEAQRTSGDAAGRGSGGAINVVLADFDMTDSLLISNSATETDGGDTFGGALRIVNDSDAVVADSTFADNVAERFGGAISAQGVNVDIRDSQFILNEISPGVVEPVNQSNGAAIYNSVTVGANQDATGTVRRNTFADNIGLPIFDSDRDTGGPFSFTTFNDNDIQSASYGTSVFRNNIFGGAVDTAGLNSMVVVHSTGPNVDKATINNTFLSSVPILGAIVAVPSELLASGAAGDPSAPEAFVGYAWSGGSATVDGGSVTGQAGLMSVGTGVHTLQVGAQAFTATTDMAPIPTANLSLAPSSVSSGQSSSLSWSLSAGDFLDGYIDQGVGSSVNANGSTTVSAPESRVYRYCAVTEQGTALAEATLLVDENPPLFADGFESGNTSAWSQTVP
ncbi:MAG: hypothetical protein AAGD38_19805 [Acidobacteriota bacterium]